jgi:hypothetical protein
VLLGRVLSAGDAQVPRVVHDLVFVHVPPDQRCRYRTVADGVREAPYARADGPAVLALAREVEGEDSAALVADWLDRQPQAFRVYRAVGRDAGEIVAFCALLRSPVAGPDSAGAHADPVVAAAQEHARSTAPSLPGDLLAVARFLVVRPGPHEDSSEDDGVAPRG